MIPLEKKLKHKRSNQHPRIKVSKNLNLFSLIVSKKDILPMCVEVRPTTIFLIFKIICLDPIDSMKTVMHATSLGMEHLNVGRFCTTLGDILHGLKESSQNLL